jgi:hypothetical protein
MKRSLRQLKAVLTESPLVLLSVGTCLWVFVRESAPDFLPVFARPSFFELTMVAVVGICAGFGGLLRKSEQGWYLALLAMILNGVCWWYAFSRIDWGPSLES